jgi:hypothetical protein
VDFYLYILCQLRLWWLDFFSKIALYKFSN